MPAVRRSPPADCDELDRAIEVFVHAFCFTRSFTHPYLPARVGPLWVVRDAPRPRKSDRYRTEEWFARGISAAEVDRVARKHARGRFTVCHVRPMTESADPIRDAYRAAHYRLHGTEPIMVHRLKRIPRFAAPVTIERVTTMAMADRLAKTARSRQVRAEDLEPGSQLRQYVAIDGDELVGWVRSIVVGETTWCSNMFVKATHRRRGIGRAMLSRMLRDDRAGGSTLAVLAASHTGAMLYPVVGYEQIAELMIYTPKER